MSNIISFNGEVTPHEASLNEWLAESEAGDPVWCGFPRCKKHNTFLTYLGCQICNS